jgi:predicted RNase H-like nuclease
MRAVLGIDVAWTFEEPSGLALLSENKKQWRCVAIAPSYTEFISLSLGNQTDWGTRRFTGSFPNVTQIVQAAEKLAGCSVHLITLDMPISTVPFCSRRFADRAISREFGSRWCSAHTPNSIRPGQLGSVLTNRFAEAGFPLKTSGNSDFKRALIEVYPHPALLSLLKRDRRVPYKISKSKRYWPEADVSTRIASLLREFRCILNAMVDLLGQIPIKLPDPAEVPTFTSLKRYEDVLDALICA